MLDQVRSQQAFQKMLSAQHILLVNDVRIDGDTLGSSLGMHHVLQAMGKRVTHFSPMPIPSSYDFLPGRDLIFLDETVLKDRSIDLIISFDCGDGTHVTDAQNNVPGKPFLISFDHHATNSMYGDLNLVLIEASSTAEVIWRFLKVVGVTPSRDAATAILTGVCTDTDIFKNMATNVAAFQAASELTMLGARVREVERHLFSNKPVSVLNLWGRVLERLHRHPTHDLVTTYILRDDFEELGCEENDLEGLVNLLISLLHGVDTVIIFRETDDGGVKGSMRTLSGNVAKIGEWFPKGGGHVKAAGLYVPNTRLRPCQGGVEVV